MGLWLLTPIILAESCVSVLCFVPLILVRCIFCLLWYKVHLCSIGLFFVFFFWYVFLYTSIYCLSIYPSIQRLRHRVPCIVGRPQSHYVSKDGFGFQIFLPLFSKCWIIGIFHHTPLKRCRESNPAQAPTCVQYRTLIHNVFQYPSGPCGASLWEFKNISNRPRGHTRVQDTKMGVLVPHTCK